MILSPMRERQSVLGGMGFFGQLMWLEKKTAVKLC